MCEHGEQYSFHAGAVGEGAHGSGSASHLAEAALDGIGGSDLRPQRGVLYLEEGQELFGISPQAPDGLGVAVLPTVLETPQGLLGLAAVGGVADAVQVVFDRLVVGPAHAVEDVADFMRPAALVGDAGIDQGQGGQKPLSAVGGDEFDAVAAQASMVEVVEEKASQAARDSPGVIMKSMISFLPSGVRPRATSTTRLAAPADGGRAHRLAQNGQQRPRHLARGDAQYETGQDQAVDIARAPGIRPQHLPRAIGAGARHRQLDIT